MIIETVCIGSCQANCYILASKNSQDAIIIDPGDEPEKIQGVLGRHKLISSIVINTHGHIDHIGADDAFHSEVYIHEDDVPFLRDPALNLSHFFNQDLKINSKYHALKDNDQIKFGGIILKVLHTPGHTPGSMCLLLDNEGEEILFSGDTLFNQGVGRTDFPLASFEKITDSIKKKLFVLKNQTRVFPGHGEATTIGQEKQNNPFIE